MLQCFLQQPENVYCQEIFLDLFIKLNKFEIEEKRNYNNQTDTDIDANRSHNLSKIDRKFSLFFNRLFKVSKHRHPFLKI